MISFGLIKKRKEKKNQQVTRTIITKCRNWKLKKMNIGKWVARKWLRRRHIVLGGFSFIISIQPYSGGGFVCPLIELSHSNFTHLTQQKCEVRKNPWPDFSSVDDNSFKYKQSIRICLNIISPKVRQFISSFPQSFRLHWLFVVHFFVTGSSVILTSWCWVPIPSDHFLPTGYAHTCFFVVCLVCVVRGGGDML